MSTSLANQFLKQWRSTDDPEKSVPLRWQSLRDVLTAYDQVDGITRGAVVKDIPCSIPGFDTVDYYLFRDMSRLFVGMVFDKHLLVVDSLPELIKLGNGWAESLTHADIFYRVWQSLDHRALGTNRDYSFFNNLADAMSRARYGKQIQHIAEFQDGSRIYGLYISSIGILVVCKY